MAKYATFRPKRLSYVPKGTKANQTQLFSNGLNKRDKKFIARIELDGKKYCLRYFDDEIEAAIAYDIKKAMVFFGEFAYLNFPGLMQRYRRQITEDRGQMTEGRAQLHSCRVVVETCTCSYYYNRFRGEICKDLTGMSITADTTDRELAKVAK